MNGDAHPWNARPSPQAGWGLQARLGLIGPHGPGHRKACVWNELTHVLMEGGC